MLNISFFGECNRNEEIYNEFSIDVSQELYAFLATGDWNEITKSLTYKHSLLSDTKFSEIGKSVSKDFILLSDDGIRFSRKNIVEINNANTRCKYIEYIDYIYGAIECLAENSSVEQDKQFLGNLLYQLRLIGYLMSNESYKFMQYSPGVNDFDNENFAIGGLFEIRNNQIFIEWETNKIHEYETILVADEILNPINLLASGIYAIAEARYEGIISNDCYAYFMDIVSSFKAEIKSLESDIFKKKS